MNRDDLGDLNAFAAVAAEGGFTRAAERLGLSQSALSHAVRRLEERLGVRLLARTTRRVAPTEAGERLLKRLNPALEDIAASLMDVAALTDEPSGLVRITASDDAADSLVWPRLVPLLERHPKLEIEVMIENRFTDIVAERFDAGVRLGESIDQDMVAVQIGPDQRMALAASPDYLARRGTPVTPRDLTGHDCINIRIGTGPVYVWEFERDGRPLNVRAEGRVTINSWRMLLDATERGLGLGFLPETYFGDLFETGRLVRLLDDWCPPYPGFHLYYPSRRQHTAGFAAVVEALRWRG